MSGPAIVAAARGWLGTPYRHRAATRGAGCDCLGLLRGVWAEVSGQTAPALPLYSADWRDGAHRDELLALARRLLVPAEVPEAGTVVLFRLGTSPWPRHCGILVAPDRFIHAQERIGVVEANLTDGWRRRVAGWFVFVESGPPA